jgi:predicted CopG family antitoxin
MVIRKTIAISAENYDKLKKFGYAGESMNRAIGKLLASAAGESD